MNNQFKGYNSYSPNQSNNQGLNVGSQHSEVHDILSRQMQMYDPITGQTNYTRQEYGGAGPYNPIKFAMEHPVAVPVVIGIWGWFKGLFSF